MNLRPYQIELTRQARELMQTGHRSILIRSATGSGKTILTANMLKTAASKGMSAFFTVHRRELVLQTIRAFEQVGLEYGIIASGFYENRKALVQIASIGTLGRRVEKIRCPKLVVWDECAHMAASTWDKIYSIFKDAYHIGLTATPVRLDGKGLGKYFKAMIHGPEVRWLIDNGYLSDYRMYAPADVDVSHVRSRMGDYAQDELAKIMDKPKLVGSAVSHYQKYLAGKRALVFCVSIEHSKHIVDQFKACGIPAAHVDGECSHYYRDQSLQKFARGEIKVISNCEIFGEGFDLPALEGVILLRPTQSFAQKKRGCINIKSKEIRR